MKNTDLTLGEKIKLIRNTQKISQQIVASKSNNSTMHISRIERGQVECDVTNLSKIKLALGIAGAPLVKTELDVYRNRIWMWNEVMNANRVSDAKIIQKELSVILHLPFEDDLILLYTMLEIRLLGKEGNIPAVKEKLNAVESRILSASAPVRNLYHRNMGFIYVYLDDQKNALAHYLQADELECNELKTDSILLASIGRIYYAVGKPFHALSYLKRAYVKSRKDRTNALWTHIAGDIASCYIVVGEYKKAKALLNKCLANAMSLSDDIAVCTILNCLGVSHIKTNNPEEGLKCFEQAEILIKDFGKNYTDEQNMQKKYAKTAYIQTLINKAEALCNLKRRSQFRDVIKLGKSMAEEVPLFNILFEALHCCMNIKNRDCRQYLENVAIPILINTPGVYTALQICEMLETYYEKHDSIKKACEIAAVAKKIYRNMLNNEDEHCFEKV